MSTRVIAFLHAINVSGRLVSNETLRAEFENLGLSQVRTFISTGNVVFNTPLRPTQTLAQQIETRLSNALGIKVPTFLRSEAELHTVAKHPAFDYSTLVAAKELHIGFVANPLSSAAVQRLMALRTPLDQFHVNGREIYWLCKARRNASAFSPAVFEQALHVPVTFRPLSTLLRMLPWIDAETPSASRKHRV
jgi:uncharacterized protein (DUF1697 family)